MGVDTAEELGIAARGALVLSIGDFMYNAFLAIGSIIIARLLGSEGYGAYSLILSVPLTLYSFISMSLDTGISRYLRLYLSKGMVYAVKDVLKSSLYLKTLLGVIGTVICFVFAKPLSDILIRRADLYIYIMMASVTVLLYSLYTYFLAVFVGFEEVWRNSVLKIVYSISRLTLSIPLLLLGLGVLGVVLSYAIGMGTAVIVGAYFIMSTARQRFRNNEGARLGVSRISRELLAYSMPLYYASLVNSFASTYQTVLLAYSLTDAEIGGYRALVNIQTLITVITIPISTALLPLYTKIDAVGDDNRLRNILKTSNRYSAIVVLPLTLLAISMSREIVYLLYGSEYLFITTYLPLLFAPFLLTGLGSITIPQMFNAIGRTDLNFKVTAISTAAFIPLSYILTSYLGFKLWGFLLALLISSVISVALYNVLISRVYGGSIEAKHIALVYLSAIITYLLLMPLLYIPMPRPVSLLRIAVGGAVYLLIYLFLLTALRAVDEKDLELFVAMFKPVPIVNTIIELLASMSKMFMKIVYSRR